MNLGADPRNLGPILISSQLSVPKKKKKEKKKRKIEIGEAIKKIYEDLLACTPTN